MSKEKVTGAATAIFALTLFKDKGNHDLTLLMDSIVQVSRTPQTVSEPHEVSSAYTTGFALCSWYMMRIRIHVMYANNYVHAMLHYSHRPGVCSLYTCVCIRYVRRGYSDGGVILIVGCLCYQTKFGNSSVVPQGRLSASLPCGTTEELPNFVW